MIVIERDHTRPALGLYGQPTAWVRMWCKCNGCGAAVSEVRENDPTEFGQGMVRANASARGGRWRCEADRVSRLYCPACQATRDGGRFGWMDCNAKVVGPAPLPRLRDLAGASAADIVGAVDARDALREIDALTRG